MKEQGKGQGRPDQKSAGQRNSHLKEQGKALSGFPNSRSEGLNKPERQPFPSVWDILERRVGLHARGSGLRKGEYGVELRELNRLLDEIGEKGTDRDRLIEPLYIAITNEPTGTLVVPVITNHLSLEEFHQLRSKVEPMSEDEIREETRKAEEEYERKYDKIIKRGKRSPYPTPAKP